MKIGGVLDFTADFGLKVSQVTAGFGYGEGYYYGKAPKNLQRYKIRLEGLFQIHFNHGTMSRTTSVLEYCGYDVG